MLKLWARRTGKAVQEYDEEHGVAARRAASLGLQRSAQWKTPSLVLFAWTALICVFVAVLAGYRALERRQQISNRVSEAQASGVLLPDGGARLVVRFGF